ncbi:Oidioi.mRNA.OKI2018_I69.chr1.g2791.t1.cds [Oikopleura dioica]|uniref:Oidioi.mRNA.OKI2018_I69.chr1.g2791.t1.cds n=1 Tax=Oikopleura dioica TaxID=34765 RepID=A0ABN7STX2_OIKDI|nr:Oidioi.mRNA.OKI2018_I69.chr1.g2791.t1.cds [Oikopleura dioica]
MMFYLKTAERDVRGYGTALFEIGTKFEPHKLLSVSPSSITLSTADFKDEESFRFRWAEIRSAAQVDKKITIKLRSGREKSLTAKNSSEAKRVVDLIQNYKLLSVMMEAPPSPQVERLKIVADEEEKSKIFKREEISQTKRHFQVQNNLISELEEDRKNLSDKLDRMQNEKDIYEGEIVRLRENIQRIDREATRTLSQYRILREMIPKADPNDLARRVERYESLKKLEGKHERSNSQSIEKKPVVYQSMTRDRIRRGNTILLLKSLEEQFQK